ncbi:hypothetical protein [Metabacillus niabensis]
MVTLRHENGDEETVVEWSLRHFQLRHMGYKEVKEDNRRHRKIS